MYRRRAQKRKVAIHVEARIKLLQIYIMRIYMKEEGCSHKSSFPKQKTLGQEKMA
jgi:hypothetical protein